MPRDEAEVQGLRVGPDEAADRVGSLQEQLRVALATSDDPS
ncbi:hypothetical protein [Streptomyces sp. NPDC006552]